jgi:ABC-type antimicrobial peptide transport system permease subunit
MSLDLAGYAVILAVLIGLVIGGVPALSARRLTITDALRVR